MGPIPSRPSRSSTASARRRPDLLIAELADPHVVRWSATELAVTHGQLCAQLGYRPGATPAYVLERLADCLRRARLEPRGLWRCVPVRVERDALECCDNGRRLPLRVGSIVAGQLRGSTVVAVFVVTAGDAISRQSRSAWQGGDPLTGCLLDAIGSALAEHCADRLACELAARCAEIRWHTTHRFSPGYCTWPTADQQALFKLLPAERIGVRLTDSGMMQPLKSVSGVIGLGPDVRWRPYPCDKCGIRDCTYRSQPHPGQEIPMP